MLHRDKSTITSALFPPAEQFRSDRPAVEPDFNACTVFLFSLFSSADRNITIYAFQSTFSSQIGQGKQK